MCAMERAESALTRARIPAVHLTGEPIGPQENFAMRAIDKTLVDEVWRELTAYAPARVASEAQAFLDLQPHAAAFSQSLTRQFDPTVQKAALGLAFLLFKILDASLAAYILEIFYAGGAVPGEYDETVRASLYCLLKTLTDALDLGHVED